MFKVSPTASNPCSVDFKTTDEMSRRERNHFLLYMFQQDVDLMTKWVLQYPNKETGGDLFGLWSGEGDNAVIHVVLGPGRNCTHGDYHFYQDVEYLRKVGSLLTQDYMLGHIGEWHSHHQLKLDRPSEGDCRTIERNFPQGSCGFLLMIANINKRHQVTFSPYVFKVISGKFSMLSGRIEVIAERSPFVMVSSIFQIINQGQEKEGGKGRQTNRMGYSNANSRDIRIKNHTQEEEEKAKKATCMGMLSSLFASQADEECLPAKSDQCNSSKTVHIGDESCERTQSETFDEPIVVQPGSAVQGASECLQFIKEIIDELSRNITNNGNMQPEYDDHNKVQKIRMTFKYRGLTAEIFFPCSFPVGQAQMAIDNISKGAIRYSCQGVSKFQVKQFVNEIRRNLNSV